jgi:hypothetical protein
MTGGEFAKFGIPKRGRTEGKIGNDKKITKSDTIAITFSIGIPIEKDQNLFIRKSNKKWAKKIIGGKVTGLDEQSQTVCGPIKRRVGGRNSDLSRDLTKGESVIDCNSLPNSKTRDSNSLIRVSLTNRGLEQAAALPFFIEIVCRE